MSLKIGIPILNGGLSLERLIRSIDIPVQVFILINRLGPVDRSVEEAIFRVKTGRCSKYLVDLQPEFVDGNLGVAGSWNRIIDRFSGGCLIVNHDIQFVSGGLRKAIASIVSNPGLKFQAINKASCFYVGDKFTESLGWFDENFYPAYREDCEMALRAIVMKSNVINFWNCDGCVCAHAVSQTLKDGSEALRNVIKESKKSTRQYYRRKWGVRSDWDMQPTFKLPFGLDGSHPADWTLDLQMRAEVLEKARILTGFDVPLIYHRLVGGLRERESLT